MLKIVLKAACVTLAVVIVSQIELIWTVYLIDAPLPASVFVVRTVVLVLAAFPASLIIFSQNERLKHALTKLSRLNRQLSHKASHDQMTGLLNREAFLEQFKQVRREQDTGALLMIDADHFKAINDAYGHLAGDEALKLLSNVIQSSVRDRDVIGRIGGEEFCVFLPGSNQAEALAVAERIRSQVERTPYHPEEGEQRRLTVSIGVAVTTVRQPVARLMRRADVSLYEAKKMGRNRIVIEEATQLAA